MGTLLATLLTLLPLLLPLFGKILPKIAPKIGGLFGGAVAGSAVAKGGFFAGVLALLSRIWGVVGRFPKWLVSLFATGGKLYFIRAALEFILVIFKSPIVLFFGLLTSAFFPTILEKLFLLIGAAVMHIFVFFFGICKKLFLDLSASEGGAGAIDEFKNAVLGSFQDLPPCFVKTMGYVYFLEDLGMIVSCMALILTISIFRVMFGAFGVGKITGNSAGL